MSSMRMVPQEHDNEDVEVNWEDQQKINQFSKLNSRLRILEGKLAELQGEKEALDDLSTELELADEDSPVLYRVGECYVHMPHARAMKRLEVEQKSIDAQIDKHANSAEECEKGMGELKRVLYAKFGSAINLDE